MNSTNTTKPPLLIDADYVIIKARALIWIGDGLALPTVFQANAGRLLLSVMESHSLEKIIVLDCFGVFDAGNHSLGQTRDFIKAKNATLVLINSADCGQKFREELDGIDCDTKNLTRPNDFLIFGSSVHRPQIDPIDLSIRHLALQGTYLKSCIRSCYRSFAGDDPEPQALNANGERRLQSTPLLAKGIYNARALISDPSTFVYITLIMAERVTLFVENAKIANRYRLLSVSLRASPFASAIGSLLSMPFEIVDHMGPRMKILEEYTFDLSPSCEKYIYIGDFCIGGSEIRIAETYATVKNTNLAEALVIGSAINPKEGVWAVPLDSLVTLCDIHPSNNYRLIE